MTDPLPHPPPTGKRFYLFGHPITHSAAPAFHNHCFTGWDGQPNIYQLWSTSKVTREVLNVFKETDFGGAAITMPIKSEILQYLDEISPESEATGACNTIVKVPTSTGFKLVGQNTDILGVRNALLRALKSHFPDCPLLSSSYTASMRGAGMIIGGGATTRSAAHAFTILGLNPIFLINRDASEIHAVQTSLPHLNLIHLKNPEDVEEHLAQPNSVKILMAVGAIPSIPPVTRSERMVHTTASAVFTIRYEWPIRPPTEVSLPAPLRPIFLEMPYKPRITTMLKVALAHNWDAIDGVQAMIEQGLAQQRMWYSATPTIEAGSDPSILGPEIYISARELCENMVDVIGDPNELDRALVDGSNV